MTNKNLQGFSGKKVIVTGHTGFKGSWLSIWLKKLGAEVSGISLEPPSQPSHYELIKANEVLENDFRIDVRDNEALVRAVENIQPDFVFHLAAQALVKDSYRSPLETYQTNVIGTLNVLETLRTLKKPCVAVLITSDKCYDNVEWDWGYRENDRLGGVDPYSASKGAAELVIRSHVKSFFPKEGLVRVGVGRAGNVIGGGDWANNRIVPDCVQAWAKKDSVELRNPNSTRPWQHVLEPLSGYINLAMELENSSQLHGEAFNFGPSESSVYTVHDLVEKMAKFWDNISFSSLPQTSEQSHEAGLLKLCCDKALSNLKWSATLNFEATVRFTAEWYQKYYSGVNSVHELSLSQIDEYISLAKQKGLKWAH